MKEIQSSKNQLIKELKKFHQKKQRDRENKYLVEGYHLVEEAVLHDAVVEQVLVDEKGLAEYGQWLAEKNLTTILVSYEVLKSLSELPTPQGIVALVQKSEEQKISYQGRWLLLDRVQDPGNVGTLIRTADAAGFTGVVLGEGTADIYSTKVLRSMQGSHFHLPIITRNLLDVLAEFKKQQVPVYGTELNKEALAYTRLPSTNQVALILGNEGQGVQKEMLEQTDKNIYIPIYGAAESLNVGIAGGILMYHFVS
ncbi:TrmH family RNA methyltransferase [Enterococcus sp. LJL98]